MFAITPIVLLVLAIAGGGAAAIDQAKDQNTPSAEPRDAAEQIPTKMEIDPNDVFELEPKFVIEPVGQPVPEVKTVK